MKREREGGREGGRRKRGKDRGREVITKLREELENEVITNN